jgi:xylulokinase
MEYHTSRAFRTTYAAQPGSILFETVLLGGAYTISWFLENFANGASLAELERAAGALPPGADGLVLVPYWNTAMNPYWDATATGIVAGWRGIHTPAHLYRAILEGIAFEQRFHTEGVEEATAVHVERYIAVGGGARSPLWLQIIADVTGRAVFASDSPEASALGAGMIAAVGGSLHPDLPTAAQAMRRITGAPTLPDPRRQEFYDRMYREVYRRLYPALRSTLASLDTITRQTGEASAV